MKKFLRAAVVAATVAASWLSPITSALASQNSCILPNTGTLSGLSLVNDANACINSLLSLYSGGSAPSSPPTGMLWFNTTTNYIQQYDGASWLNLWFVDATNHLTTPLIGGGIVTASLASAATTDIGSVPQPFVNITGTTPITSLGASASVGSIHVIKFGGSLTLTYNVTSLILPTGNSINTQAGDIAIAIALGSGNWQIISYTPATGFAIASSFPLGAVLYGDFGTTPGSGVLSKFVFGFGQALTRTSYPAYTTAVTRSQSGTLTASNATIPLSNTAGFAVGMPVEGTGIAASCTIASFIANTSITLNSSSCVTGTGSQTVNVFLTGYGTAGTSATVGVKDCRGRVLAGRDDLGGTAAGRLNAGGFGLATGDNLAGGNQAYTMQRSDMPNITQIFHGTSGGVNVTLNQSVAPASAAGQWSPGGGSSYGVTGAPVTPTASGSFTPAGTIDALNGNVTQTNMNVVQPTVISDCIVAVLP